MSDRLRGDLIAGLTVWAVLVPEALAYAAIAGVSPVVGLYAAPGALILHAALGSSRHLVTGPMAATAALLEQLDDDLARRHVRLLVARDVGLVRDVLRTAADDPSLRHVYPSVQAAVDAASGRG